MLTGKTALVTGASRGIGAAVARKLAENGAFVYVNYNGSQSRADEVVAAIKEAYKNGTYNVSAEDFADRIIEKYSDKGEIRF